MNGYALTWFAFALVLAVFAVRAWVVETRRGRLNTAGSLQRTLTVAAGGSLLLLVVLMAANGGLTLAELLIEGDPAIAQEAARDQTPTTPGDTGQPAVPPVVTGG